MARTTHQSLHTNVFSKTRLKLKGNFFSNKVEEIEAKTPVALFAKCIEICWYNLNPTGGVAIGQVGLGSNQVEPDSGQKKLLAYSSFVTMLKHCKSTQSNCFI